MNKTPFQCNVSFADAEFCYFQISENYDLTIYVTSWDEKEIKIEFFDVLSLSFLRGSIIDNLFEIANSQYLEDSIKRHYKEKPLNPRFKHYQLIDIDDLPFIEVVAERAQVVKTDKMVPFTNLR